MNLSISRHTDESRYPELTHHWILASAGMTNEGAL